MNGYEALRQRAAWIDLSDRGKIRVTGEDRARLLHALCTNDVQNLAPGRALYTFFLNEKGRIFADAYLYNAGDYLWLDTEPELRAKLIEHLDRYIIADDVTLEDETAAFACVGVEGPQALELAPPADFVIHASATGQPAARALLPVSVKEDYINRLSETAIPQANADEARIVRLENGVPRYGEDISDKYLVQETRILHAVHLNKGCYLGQEIVERVRSRGQVHRFLTPLRISGTTPPAPGTKMMGNGAELGEITSAAYSPGLGEVAALGYLRREAVESASSVTLAGTEPPVAVRLHQS